jgi:nucleolar protein 4
MDPPRKKQRVDNENDSEIKDLSIKGANKETAKAKDISKSNIGNRQLFVRSLPPTASSESLAEYFSQSYPLKHATVVVDPATKESRQYGFVTFADTEDAQRARDEFDGSSFQGRKIKVEIAESRSRKIENLDLAGPRRSVPSEAAIKKKASREKERKEERQPPKLIVRNLPWSITKPDQLALLFRSYGKVKYATIPSKKPGLMAGFGFVNIRGRKNAEKAIKGVNGKEIDGRTLAVDWAIEKEVWNSLNDKSVSKDGPEEVDLEEADAADEAREECDDEVEEELEDSDSEGSNQEQFDESDGSVLENIEGQSSTSKLDTGLTLFIRNLPFTSTDEKLQEHFRQFGAIRYARGVLDHVTERPKGTAFVCFYNEDEGESCLRKAPRQSIGSQFQASKGNTGMKHSILENELSDSSGCYTIDGRVLQVSRAVDRSEAARLTEEGTNLRDRRDRDKRRLYLLSEGTIPSNSPLYETLPASERLLRESSAKQRKTIIQNNPTLHLSLTRLSIRNIPRRITSKDLKALAREAVVEFAKDVKAGKRQQLSKEENARGGDEMKEGEKVRKSKGKGIVKQAKIVYEGREGGKVTEDSGAGRSRGYGFIEYSSHRWALMGLRWLNGHMVKTQVVNAIREDPQERKKRLIVEFAIENAQVVMRRKQQESKARERSIAIMEQRASGEISEGGKRPLSKDQAMSKMRKGGKRKRNDQAHSAGQEEASHHNSKATMSTDQEKLTKRQLIIAKKRRQRRERKQGSRG